MVNTKVFFLWKFLLGYSRETQARETVSDGTGLYRNVISFAFLRSVSDDRVF